MNCFFSGSSTGDGAMESWAGGCAQQRSVPRTPGEVARQGRADRGRVEAAGDAQRGCECRCAGQAAARRGRGAGAAAEGSKAGEDKIWMEKVQRMMVFVRISNIKKMRKKKS